MPRNTIAVVGFGDLGERVFERLPKDQWRCCALRRRASEVPAGVEGVAVDLRRPETLGILEELKPAFLMLTLSPAGRDAAAYRDGFAHAMAAIVAGLGAHRPLGAFFVSSTRVYSEADGGWVDEDSPVAASDPHVASILEAEQRLHNAIPASCVLRAAGLYGGSGPGPLLERVAAGRLSQREPLRYSNRVHRDDVAGFIAQAINSKTIPEPGIINLVDNEPAAIQAVEAWFCEQLGRPYEPPALPSGETKNAPAAHKRIANGRLRASGYTLRYPDFRAGYAGVLHNWTVHSEGEDGLDLD